MTEQQLSCLREYNSLPEKCYEYDCHAEVRVSISNVELKDYLRVTGWVYCGRKGDILCNSDGSFVDERIDFYGLKLS